MSAIPTYFAQVPEAGLKAALQADRPEIISQISASGLKGRGGAGFPTAVKWNFAAAAQAERKFVICNADEGEPGTFKDRVILMEHADLVFEGMTIAAKAIGAKEGILFLRGEYAYLRGRPGGVPGPPAREEPAGQEHPGQRSGIRHPHLHGRRRLHLRRGDRPDRVAWRASGASRGTGRRSRWTPATWATPRSSTTWRHWPGPPASWPTGRQWFRSVGTEKSTGRKIFSVSGDCARPGVYEFPMGITVPSLLKEVGGEDAKAVQVGGASGQCVPARDFEPHHRLRGHPHRRLGDRLRPTAGHAGRAARTSWSSSWTSPAASAPPAAWATPSCWRGSRCSRPAPAPWPT